MCHLSIPRFISHVDNKSDNNPIISTADMSSNTCADGMNTLTTTNNTIKNYNWSLDNRTVTFK